jgi:cysteine-rich repeat protein
MRKLVWLGSVVALIWMATPAKAQVCAGDCNGSDSVTVNEVVICVNIALGTSPVSAGSACDVNGNGSVVVSELVTAVNAVLNGCHFTPGPTGTITPSGAATPTATPNVAGFCGDGAMNVDGETCDDGNNVGGDGCAANCTIETRRETTLDPAVSKSTVQFLTFPLPLTLSGTQALTAGRPRDVAVFGPGGQQLYAPGEFPVVVKASDIRFDPISLARVGCACVRGIEVSSFGPGVAGVGVVGCGQQGLTDVDFLVEQDHNTTPGSPNNSGSVNGLEDDPDCTHMFDAGGGLSYSACREGTGAACSMPLNTHIGICQSPRKVTFMGGQAPRGSVLIRNSTAIAVLTNTVQDACHATKDRNGNCSAPEFGPDCLPCTEDDPNKGMATIAPTTSGTASVLIYDANQQQPGVRLGDGQACSGGPCIGRVTGEPTNCDTLDDPTSGLTGSLVTAFPGLDQVLGDAAITTTLKAHQ